MQTKTQSMVEAMLNVLIGYVIAVLSQLVIFPQFGIHIDFTSNLLIGAWFTVISIVRSYYVRRFFNYIDFKRLIK